MATIVIFGKVISDPEFKQTGNKAMCRLAVSESRKVNRNGKYEWENTVADCVVFGAVTESLSKNICKGDFVTVVGECNIRMFQTRDGETRATFNVVADRIHYRNMRSAGREIVNVDLNDTDDITGDLPF